MNEVARHFDGLAPVYDTWKKRNWYYYRNLKDVVRSCVPENRNVLEIGTGTGDILASLRPKTGLGIDISAGMIAVARGKYSGQENLSFQALSLDEARLDLPYDYFILIDVVEHVENLGKLIAAIRKKAHPRTAVLVSMANPRWEPLLMLLEKLKMKMPEGLHYRVPSRELVRSFRAQGFVLEKRASALILPAYLPVVSDTVNRWFLRIPFVRRLGLIEYFIFRLSPADGLQP